MNAGTQQSRLRFSLQHLMLLVALLSLWLTMVHYCGQLAVIMSSSLLGVLFVLAGMALRWPLVASVGAVLSLAGPLLLGMVAAMLNR